MILSAPNFTVDFTDAARGNGQSKSKKMIGCNQQPNVTVTMMTSAYLPRAMHAPRVTSHALFTESWREICSFLSFNDVRAALDTTLMRSDAHAQLRADARRARFESCLLWSCEFLDLHNVGSCVEAFVKQGPADDALARSLSEVTLRLLKRKKTWRRPAACACCFPREH